MLSPVIPFFALSIKLYSVSKTEKEYGLKVSKI
jgi:hypothetical protein